MFIRGIFHLKLESRRRHKELSPCMCGKGILRGIGIAYCSDPHIVALNEEYSFYFFADVRFCGFLCIKPVMALI